VPSVARIDRLNFYAPLIPFDNTGAMQRQAIGFLVFLFVLNTEKSSIMQKMHGNLG